MTRGKKMVKTRSGITVERPVSVSSVSKRRNVTRVRRRARVGKRKVWKQLKHNGPLFPSSYHCLPNHVKLYYKGKGIGLSKEAEEVAGFYAKMLKEKYTKNSIFNRNFFDDWRKVMTGRERNLITDLKYCDFSYIHDYYEQQSVKKRNLTKEEKLKLKAENEKIAEKHGHCLVNGQKEKIGNFRIEPPGLFRGRGNHPKMGRLKKRVLPEDVTINIGENEKVPPPSHGWKEVRHDNTVAWLSCWTENISNQIKYIMLNPSANLKKQKDMEKFETARKLADCINDIRHKYKSGWNSKCLKTQQLSVALYFIDKLALRAGHEKPEGKTADTVGCCSLRVEHIKLHRRKKGKNWVVHFDFPGKDTIRYVNSVPVEKPVFQCLKLFMSGKLPHDKLFDKLNVATLNKYLTELMDGLTAKVFRTYNSSKTLQRELSALTKRNMNLQKKLSIYDRANRSVALLCNHQRTVPKGFDKQVQNLQKKINQKKNLIKQIEKELKTLKRRNKNLYQKKLKKHSMLKEHLEKLQLNLDCKNKNKSIALGTSKLNYLDPRITVAWCKKWSIDIEKIYNKSQREKFEWAIQSTPKDFKF